jgi:BNR repeat protein
VSALSHDLGAVKGVNVFSSTDHGKSFTMVGQPHFPAGQSPCEHMLVERRDGSIWMLVRTLYGIGSAESTDRGRTWSAPRPSGIQHPSTRFFIRRLHSGRLLLVKNSPPDSKARSHLTALVSDDDGRSWSRGFELDSRMNVSYPDGVQAPDGKIYIVYDRERFTAREILMAVFTEDDVRGVASGSPADRFRVVVNRAGTE